MFLENAFKPKSSLSVLVGGIAFLLFLPLQAKGSVDIHYTPFRGIDEDNIRWCYYAPVLFGHRIGNVGNERNPRHWYFWSVPRLSSEGFNDKAGSGCVAPGWEITVYTDSEYRGDQQTISAQSSTEPVYFNFQEGSGFNNKVSSIKVWRYEYSGRRRYCQDQFSCADSGDFPIYRP